MDAKKGGVIKSGKWEMFEKEKIALQKNKQNINKKNIHVLQNTNNTNIFKILNYFLY